MVFPSDIYSKILTIQNLLKIDYINYLTKKTNYCFVKRNKKNLLYKVC